MGLWSVVEIALWSSKAHHRPPLSRFGPTSIKTNQFSHAPPMKNYLASEQNHLRAFLSTPKRNEHAHLRTKKINRWARSPARRHEVCDGVLSRVSCEGASGFFIAFLPCTFFCFLATTPPPKKKTFPVGLPVAFKKKRRSPKTNRLFLCIFSAPCSISSARAWFGGCVRCAFQRDCPFKESRPLAMLTADHHQAARGVTCAFMISA
jgi:hypothetical protein